MTDKQARMIADAIISGFTWLGTAIFMGMIIAGCVIGGSIR